MHRQLEHPHLTFKADGNLLGTRIAARSEPLFDRWAGRPPVQLDDMLRIHEYERQRMGQELHDSAGQLLVALQLNVARLRDIEGSSGQADLIREIQETVRQIDKEIRSLAFLHYPAELGDRSLGSSLENLALGFGRRTGIRTSFACGGAFAHLNENISTALLRVAQEALVNVHRHSQAKSVKVMIKNSAERIELTISDDGIGMPANMAGLNSRGIGVSGMRYRIEALGGCFSIRSLKRGTKVCASVPVSA